MGRNQHVVPSPKGGWNVRAENSERATRHVQTQQEAIDIARDIARNQKSEVVIHRPDGRIRDKDSCGPDPCPPKDRR
jgi:uncharacterized protein YdaT